MSTVNLDELVFWIDRYTGASETIVAALVEAVVRAFSDVDFYNTADVQAAAEIAASAVESANPLVTALTAQYVAMTASAVLGVPVPTPNIAVLPLRNNTPLVDVYQRPAKLLRLLVSRGEGRSTAFARAIDLLAVLARTDVMLSKRQASRDALVELQRQGLIKGYRRVVHPELSTTGSCGLCIVASDNFYTVAQLMPIHANCNCTVLPVTKEQDPGSSLNNMTLGDFYDAAGGTSGFDLKKLRYVVNEHGEYGPVLGVAGQRFTGPDDLEDAA